MVMDNDCGNVLTYALSCHLWCLIIKLLYLCLSSNYTGTNLHLLFKIAIVKYLSNIMFNVKKIIIINVICGNVPLARAI